MRIYTRTEWTWNGTEYVRTHTEFYQYDGPVAHCCGATSAQTGALATQTALTNQIMTQAGAVFGNSSQVFNDLVGSLAPTVKAGPNQQGFSAAENANLTSQAISQTGQAYKNAKSATGDAIAAEGGGNDSSTTSGVNAGVQENLASSAADSEAAQLGQITEANYATGRQNYDTAVGDLQQAPGVFSTATGLDTAASKSAEGEATTANQIASQNQSWVQGVTGALGGVAGAATTGGMSLLKPSGSGSNSSPVEPF